jgi:transposase
VVLPQGIGYIAKRLPQLLEDGENGLPGQFRMLLHRLGEHLKEMDRQVEELEREIKTWHRDNEASRKLEEIPGIAPITASALVATVGDVKCFEDGRQVAAWQGLVPRQHSTGGKQTLLGISKRGDTYLKTLLIHGARSVVRVCERKPDRRLYFGGRIVLDAPHRRRGCAIGSVDPDRVCHDHVLCGHSLRTEQGQTAFRD